MKRIWLLFALIVAASPLQATNTVTAWRTVFKGIEHAVGTNFPDGTNPRLQVVHCMRVDLMDPDVRLFTTPRPSNYVAGVNETTSLSVSNFLKNNGLAVAADANFYQPGDPNSEGEFCTVYGLQVCTGSVVSLPDSGPDQNGRYASLLFTSNKVASVNYTNRPPATNPPGTYFAITGYFPILSNGVDMSATAPIVYPDPTFHDVQPRTIYGLTQDKRYLLMVTIDGRQPGYSDGANDQQSAQWMLQLGAWEAIMMDGGGSTALYRADCLGNPIAVNHSSYIGLRGRERFVGSHFGVSAPPAPTALRNLTVLPGDNTAILTWETDGDGTTQVEYGTTSSYGSVVSNPALTTTHIVTLNGLNPGRAYYYRASSVVDGETLSAQCAFLTTNAVAVTELVNLTNSWKYFTENLDGINWTATNYSEPGWLGPSPALLYVENNPEVAPKNTFIPPGTVPLPPTYYFRTHFSFSGGRTGLSLSLSGFLDDGAVFYLNGREAIRIRMGTTNIIYTSLASGANPSMPPCGGDAPVSCPTVTNLVGNVLTNLVNGDNVLAAEVHNFNVSSPDMVFGFALSAVRAVSATPRLFIYVSGDQATLYWNGSGFTLQRSTDLSSPANWSDVPGPVTQSPWTVTTDASVFYRLRN
jgi:hypothetical protein